MKFEEKISILMKMPYQEKSNESISIIMESYPTTFKLCGQILDSFEMFKFSDWGFKNPRKAILTFRSLLVIDNNSFLKRDFT